MQTTTPTIAGRTAAGGRDGRGRRGASPRGLRVGLLRPVPGWLRTMPALLVLLLALPFAMLGQPAGAAELRMTGIGPVGASPAPGYPVPRDEGMVFYLQRSTNANTVVYAARFGADGTLDAGEPVTAYWRRFNSDGDAKKLSMLERRFAYGVNARPRAGGGFDVRFMAIPDLPVVLEQRGPGQAVLTIAPEGQPIDLTHGFLQVEEGGLTPSVTGLRLFGRRRADGQPVEITYSVAGGQISG